jgi:hypothetical protein
MNEQPYLVFEEGDERNRESWFVVESKAKAIDVLINGYARNVLPIDQETYNKYKKLEEVVSSAQWEMYAIEKLYQDAMHYDESFFNDPEYQEARKFNEMWREAHRMNRQFDCEHKWEHRYYETAVDECHKCWLDKPCESKQTCPLKVEPKSEPLAEWEKELLGLINKEETNE